MRHAQKMSIKSSSPLPRANIPAFSKVPPAKLHHPLSRPHLPNPRYVKRSEKVDEPARASRPSRKRTSKNKGSASQLARGPRLNRADFVTRRATGSAFLAGVKGAGRPGRPQRESQKERRRKRAREPRPARPALREAPAKLEIPERLPR